MRDKPEKSFVDFLIICQVGDAGLHRRFSEMTSKPQPRRLRRTLAVLHRRLRRYVLYRMGTRQTGVSMGAAE